MKTIHLSACAILLCITTAAYSQQANKSVSDSISKPSPLAQHELNAIMQQVSNVTSNQETKMLALEETYSKGMEQSRSGFSGTRDEMRIKIRNLKEDRDYKLRSVLSADQFAQYQNMPEHRNEDSDNSGSGVQH